MINIRPNTFETNSSSTHSLIILGGNKYLEAFDAAFPESFESLKGLFNPDKLRYTGTEVRESLEKIGATLEDGVIDFTNVDEEEFDFGYVDEKAYADFAHKLLFVCTMIDGGYCNSCYDNDYKDYFVSAMWNTLNQYSIKSIKHPKDGYTGIDHQSADDITWEIKYNIESFLTRRDYVLILSHD